MLIKRGNPLGGCERRNTLLTGNWDGGHVAIGLRVCGEMGRGMVWRHARCRRRLGVRHVDVGYG